MKNSSSHETVVVISQGKPTTLIKPENKFSINAGSSQKLPFKFNSNKSKSTIDQIEAKRLKSENALLLSKIKVLEKDLNAVTKLLADDCVVCKKRQETSESKLSSDETHDRLMTTAAKSFSSAETQTFCLDLEPETDINCNNMTCLRCGAPFNCNVNLVQLVDQANRNTANNKIVLKIESPKITSPVSPTKSTLDETGDELSTIPCIPAQQQMDETFQKLQEELVVCKLREAESSLGFKELQQKVNQLGKHWQQYLKDNEHAKNAGDIKTRTVLDLREAVMALKVRETCMVSDFNELKQKLIELETENNVSKRQAKRLQEEQEKLEEELSQASLREDELVNNNKDLERRISDLDTKYQEDLIMFKIKDAESCQAAAAMRRRVAELEIEKQELTTALKLINPKHSEWFEKIRSQQNVAGAGKMLEGNQDHASLAGKPDATTLQYQPNVLELLSECDMSDIMTESFIADTMFLQPSLLINNDSMDARMSSDPNKMTGDILEVGRNCSNRRGSCGVELETAGRLEGVDSDSLERLN